MQSTWSKALAFTLLAEGGWYDDPRGGPTNHGITLDTYREYAGNHDLTADDLRAIPDATVSDLYSTRFWAHMGCDALPAGADLMVFDAGVMSGVQNSLYLLQRAVGVTVDGNIGPKTLAAIQMRAPARTIELIRLQQWRYYGEVHGANPALIGAWRARLTKRTWAAQDVALQATYGAMA